MNTAARIAGVTGSDSIFVSSEVWEQVQLHVEGHSCGLQSLKGMKQTEVFAIQSGTTVFLVRDGEGVREVSSGFEPSPSEDTRPLNPGLNPESRNPSGPS